MIKSQVRYYVQLMRWDKPVGALLLLWPTYWALWLASSGIPDYLLLTVFTAGTWLMRSVGCVLNDYADRDLDKLVFRTKDRPLTRGLVSRKETLVLVLLLFALALLCLLPLNNFTRWLSLPAVFLAATYPFMKRFFVMPQLYLGLAFSFGIFMAYAAVSDYVPGIAVLLYTGNIFWTLAYDTVYAIADKPDDMNTNIYSAAITLGRYDVAGVMVFYILFMLSLTGVGIYYGLGFSYWLALAAVAAGIGKQYFFIKDRNRDHCYRAFLQNGYFGLIIFLGLSFDFLLKS